MLIVEYTDKYKEQIKKLISDVLAELGSPPAPGDHQDEDLDHILEVYSGRGRFWVAIEKNKVGGTVGIKEIDSNTAKLKRMFVKPEYRGTGLAQNLLDTAQKFSIEHAYTEIVLWSAHVMKRAHSFYEKNGFMFVEENQWAKFYRKTL